MSKYPFEKLGNITCNFEEDEDIVINLGNDVVVPKNDRELWLGGRFDNYHSIKTCLPAKVPLDSFQF